MADENKNLPAKNSEPHKLPTLTELHALPEEAFKNDQFKSILNKKPPEKWLKKHPMAKVKDDNGKEVAAKYLPIDKAEFLLDMIFQNWKNEILREGVMFHSIYVTVRVHYKHPVTQEWLFHDGVGACKVQSDKDMPFNDNTIKASGVQMALPAAAAYALKDAADHLGEIFGRNVNRANSIEFTGGYYEDVKTPKNDEEQQEEVFENRILAMIEAADTIPRLNKIKAEATTTVLSRAWDEKFKKLNQK